MIKFLRVKWENIFAIATSLILIGMTIKYFIINGFDFNNLMFDILYISLTIFAFWYSFRYSRRMFLEEELKEQLNK